MKNSEFNNFLKSLSSFNFNLLNFSQMNKVTYFCTYYTPEKSKHVFEKKVFLAAKLHMQN